MMAKAVLEEIFSTDEMPLRGNITYLTYTYIPLDVVFIILSTELMVQWNHIEGVDSISGTGQLIPVVVGGVGFLDVLQKSLGKAIHKGYRK
jgi:hypothetical protein